MSEVQTIQLNEGWSWKQRSKDLSDTDVLDELQLPSHDGDSTTSYSIQEAWRKAQAFPSEIHVELLKAGLIPDPYIGFNEHKVQWIGDVEWLYKCSFAFTGPAAAHRYAVLEFEGLDTVCDVYLNGTKILSTDNQFQTHSCQCQISLDDARTDTDTDTDTDTSPVLKEDSPNTLLLHFKSAKALAKAEEAKYGKVRAGSTNLGDPSRVYVRKAQYDWRWDWGPELMTAGPYRPITLKTYTARIKDVHTRAYTEVSGARAPVLKLDVTVELDKGLVQALEVEVEVVMRDFGSGLEIRRAVVPLALRDAATTTTATVADPAAVLIRDAVEWKFAPDDGVGLWWPVGYGEQKLYDVEVRLLGPNGEVVDTQVKRTGFRHVELIQEPLVDADRYGKGTSFVFEVNGVRIFAGGSNWIPADNFLTTISDARYRAWLTLLRDGNQNMVRVWGGGVYEPDVFYDLCDELGILVWQDFQFACGVYPAHEAFVRSVRQEAEQNVRRLRHHPALALFCGNNEDYQMVLQWGDTADLPARKLYEEVFPEIVAALTGPAAPVPYHRGSPYGGEGWDTADPTVGDVHQWNVWGGKELLYQDYDVLGGRFVSEFGVPSMPDLRTIAYWMGGAKAEAEEEEEWHAQSKIMAQHTKAGSFERRFAILLNENFRITSDFESHVYNTQIMQAEAVGYAYQVWRRAWQGRGKEFTSGVLVWQLNDCWPGTSWAIADYFLRPKPAYFAIKRQLAPVTINISRTVHKNRANDRPRQFYEFGAIQSRSATLDIWGTNATLLPLPDLTLELHFYDLNINVDGNNSRSSWTHSETHAVVLRPNQSTELLTAIPCPGPPQDQDGSTQWTASHSVVVSARLVDAAGHVIARCADWPQPYRYLTLPDPGVRVQVEGERVRVSVERPVKGLWLSVRGEQGEGEGEGEQGEVVWSDNALDVVPGDAQSVVAKGLGGRTVRVAYLGKEKASVV